jgi:uncharacterized protein YidB (DUF937 family)
MGLLDVIGGVLGQSNARAQPSGMAGVLTQLLAGQGYGQNQGGGLSGLIDQFRQAGMGHVADSWVSNGPNQAVAPQQLQRVFGEEQVETMAQQAGMPTDSFLSQLSQHLPRVVDGVTPNGRVPEDGTISV